MTTKAFLAEIFDSFQGEGIYLGVRQLFIRFSGCNLACAYCDTKYAIIAKQYRVENTPGQAGFKYFDNPILMEDLFKIVSAKLVKQKNYHSIAITGGEPLLQVKFLKNFLPKLQTLGMKLYLETNGVLPDHLLEVIDFIDMVAFDVKLPSATGQSDYRIEHQKALAIAAAKKVFVKAVFTKESRATEIDRYAKMVAEVDADIPFVLQPVSPTGKIKQRPDPGLIFSFFTLVKRHLNNVRVVPQIHKVLKIH